MTANRADFGDRSPSDIGDVPPVDKTATMGERDYRIRSEREAAFVKVMEKRSASPDLGIKPERKPVRTTYTAIVVKDNGNGSYICVRQDGKRGICYLGDVDGIYDSVYPGLQVSITEDDRPGRWLITGGTRRKEMFSVRRTNPTDVGPTQAETTIVLTTKLQRTGDDADGNNEELNLEGGGIKVTPVGGGAGQYEISYVVTVEYTGDTAAAGDLVGQNFCETDYLNNGDPENTELENFSTNLTGKQLLVDNSTGLELVERTSVTDEKFLELRLGLKDNLAQPDMVPFFGTTSMNYDQISDVTWLDPQAAVNRVRWTHNLRVGGSLTIGSNSLNTGAFHWLKIGMSGTGASNPSSTRWGNEMQGLWLTSRSDVRLIFPENQPGYNDVTGTTGGRHLTIRNTGAPPYFDLDWTEPGVSGTISYKDGSGTTRQLTFDRGICVSGYGLTNTSPRYTITGKNLDYTDSEFTC